MRSSSEQIICEDEKPLIAVTGAGKSGEWAERFAEDQAVDRRKIRKVYLQCRFAAGSMVM